MYDIFNELVSKPLAERQKKKKEEEARLSTFGSNNPYANEVNLNNLTPTQRAQLAAVNTQAKQNNENATLPTLTSDERAALNAEQKKVTNVITPTTSTTTPTETDTTKGEKEKDTENATLESTLVEILNKLQTGYTQSDEVKAALDKWNAHLDTKPPEWNGGSYLNPLNDIIGQINNRSPFAYDVNADALYQMYKDQYMVGGKMAMTDTMGQASAMTGGYGNSYANMVGNQAYQGYLQQLNGVVPELYQLALNKYNAEGDALYDKANLYKAMYDQEYGEHIDNVSQWYTEGERLGDMYSMLANDDYGKYVDEYNRAFKEYQLAIEDVSGTGTTPETQPNTKTETTDNITVDILDRLKEFDNDEDVDRYLTDLADRGIITPVQSGELYNEYSIKPLMDRIWTMVDNGGVNWIGIDRNGVVKDDRGREYKLIDLKNAIIKELHANNPDNLSSREIEAKARQYIIDLQNKLGISDRGKTSSEKK